MKSERTDKTTVVFDTNVFISGYLWNGKAREALRLIRKNTACFFAKNCLMNS